MIHPKRSTPSQCPPIRMVLVTARANTPLQWYSSCSPLRWRKGRPCAQLPNFANTQHRRTGAL